MEVMSPVSKSVQTYIMNRLLVYLYREFRAVEKRGVRPSIRADELSAQFPSLSEAFLRKRLKHCADLQVLFLGVGFTGIYYMNNYYSPAALDQKIMMMENKENIVQLEVCNIEGERE